MQQLTHAKISNTLLVDAEHLQIIWSYSWYQEDINSLSEYFFSLINRIEILEHNQGADRESIRFNWQKGQFFLHFDYYSQSCWLAGISQQDNAYLPYLAAQLKQYIDNE